jgi:6,7-dimethyl-8-ribityllumazine synthase
MQRKHYAKKILLPDGSRLRIGIVVADFNSDITVPMLDGAIATLEACKVKKSNIRAVHVPGSFELPYACLALIKSGNYDALIALGCIIKGETTHDIYIATATANGIMNLSLQYKTPIAFGIITTNNLAQAKVRSSGKANKGVEAAITAVTMAKLR